jgi:hypothetical protein
LKLEISEMSRTVRTAGIIVLIVAAVATLDFLEAKSEAEITVTGEKAKGAGGPPVISPFHIMLKLGKALPLEDWKFNHLIFEGR